jgi:hypothetical protein
MSVLVFDTPTIPYDSSAIIGQSHDAPTYTTSYKLYEFHNCEFDYNSSKSGIGAINNGQGIQPEYTIEISYDDCYESRYNEFLGRTDFGDLVEWDNNIYYDRDGKKPLEYESQYENSYHTSPYQMFSTPERLEGYPEYNIKTGILNNLVGTGLNWAKEELTSLYLGNIYGFSLAELNRNAKDLLTGNNLLNSVREGVEFWREQKTKKLNPWDLSDNEIMEEIGSLNLNTTSINYNDYINNMNQPITETLRDNSFVDDTEEYGNRDYNDHINNMNQPITKTLRGNSSVDDIEEYGDRDYNDHINNMNKQLNINIFKPTTKHVNNQSAKINGISIANNL